MSTVAGLSLRTIPINDPVDDPIDDPIDEETGQLDAAIRQGGAEPADTILPGSTLGDPLIVAPSPPHPAMRNIPVGRWRTSFGTGWLAVWDTPLFWNALCCPSIVLRQLMVRLGHTGPTRTFASAAAAAGIWVFPVSMLMYESTCGNDFCEVDLSLILLVNLISHVVVVHILFCMCTCRMRRHVRARYNIHDDQGGDCMEDSWLSCCCFCQPCSLVQMARHTANHDLYRSVCCSRNGLSSCAFSETVHYNNQVDDNGGHHDFV